MHHCLIVSIGNEPDYMNLNENVTVTAAQLALDYLTFASTLASTSYRIAGVSHFNQRQHLVQILQRVLVF